MELELKEKVAIVTAGGGAICGEVARQLAAEGAGVAVWDIATEAAGKTVDEISRTGGRAVAIHCDGTDEKAVQRATAETVERLGVPSILVNGAGGSSPRTTTSPAQTFFDLDPSAMIDVLKLNYLSAVLAAQRVGEVMLQTGESGAIVNISSVAGILPLSRALTYSDAKAALVSFTRWLAVELPQYDGCRIRVNTVAPGFALTEQNRFLLVDRDSGEATDRGKTILSRVPLHRYALPQEIAPLVVFLASEKASFINGSVFTVDGGFGAYSGV